MGKRKLHNKSDDDLNFNVIDQDSLSKLTEDIGNIKKKIKTLDNENKKLKSNNEMLENRIDELSEIISDYEHTSYNEETEETPIKCPEKLLTILIKEKFSHTSKQTIKNHTDLSLEYMKLAKHSISSGDLNYFISLDISDKKIIINEEKNFKNTESQVPLRFQILKSTNIPCEIKYKILEKLNILNKQDSYNGKLSSWIDGLMKIPWNINKELEVGKSSNKIKRYLQSAKEILDDTIYGQLDTKEHILQILGKMITNKDSMGNVFAIYGPMGTGKTTIIKEGLSKVLNIPFNFIPLGGTSDSSYLDGHSYTYEGSIPGRIVDCLKASKCMNPIFYFDELDKVSDTPKGQEIINLLIHLTDQTQNTNFQDKYYAGIPFDLSKAMFIFSFNHLEKINPILRDRMNMIKVSGFKQNEKKEICTKFLIPKIIKEYNINCDDIIFNDEVINHLINTTKEEGVRSIKKKIDNIVSKINIVKLIFRNKKDKKEAKNIMNIKLNDITFPLVLTNELVNRFIKTGDFDVVVLGWSLSLDPDQYNIWHSSQQGPGQFNFLGYSNKNVDKLLEVGRKELNLLKREKIYHEFSKYLLEDSPIIYLYAGYSLSAVHKRVKGIKQPSPPAGIYHNNYDWFIPKPLRRNEIME